MKKLTKLIAALAASASLGNAMAASYYLVAPIQVAAPTSSITVELSALPSGLPDAMVNTNYTYDLNALLAITGDSALDKSLATWSAVGLPDGLGIAGGVLQGSPTTKTAEGGQTFQVVATYKTKQGSQSYTIKVGDQLLQATQISAGWSHSCAVTPAGTVKCWGSNGAGELGNGTNVDSAVPVTVTGLTDVASVTVGVNFSCALTYSGGAKCWGEGRGGSLGTGWTPMSSNVPLDVYGLTSGVASISAGSEHACATTTTGGAKCWGRNAYGQTGVGHTYTLMIPMDVSGLTSGVSRVSAGAKHTCALTTGGAVQCWGDNSSGQLGNGTDVSSNVPVASPSLTSGVVSLTTSVDNTCVITSAGGAKCWGSNYLGQLGSGDAVSRSVVPVDVAGLTIGVSYIAAGHDHRCAITTAGAVKCWGSNSNGQLGTASLANSNVPVSVSGLSSGASVVTGGRNHTCAIVSGVAKCWGANSNGQLGDGTTVDSTTAVGVRP